MTSAIVALSVGVVASAETHLPQDPLAYTLVTISRVRKGYWNSTIRYPKFGGDTPVAKLSNAKLGELAAHETKEWAEQTTKDMEKPTEEWSYEYAPTVLMAQPDLLSIQMTNYSYTGGAHPNTIHSEFNYGMVWHRARKLTLQDLFKPKFKALPYISKLVLAKLKAKEASWVLDGTASALTKQQGDEFVIKSDRLVFIFSPYEMGSYAEGTYEIPVPFSALAGKLNPAGPLKALLADR